MHYIISTINALIGAIKNLVGNQSYLSHKTSHFLNMFISNLSITFASITLHLPTHYFF